MFLKITIQVHHLPLIPPPAHYSPESFYALFLRSTLLLVQRQGDAHVCTHIANGTQQTLHICGEKMADGTNAETIGFCDFTWIDYKVFLVQALVELVELEVGMARKEIGGDHVARHLGTEQLFKAKLLHPFLQHGLIMLVAPGARLDPSLLHELAHGLAECQQRVGGWSKTKLALVLKTLVLRYEI